jgi:hypothetical protein
MTTMKNTEPLIDPQHKLTLKAKKCHLCCQQITCLGHFITKDGIREDPDKVATIAQFPIPRKGDKKALMSFLGVTGHFQKFIKDYHIIIEPLRDLLKEGNTWEWTAKQDITSYLVAGDVRTHSQVCCPVCSMSNT